MRLGHVVASVALTAALQFSPDLGSVGKITDFLELERGEPKGQALRSDRWS